MAFFKEFPFTRTYDSDLAWLIRRMKEVLARMDSVEERMATLEALVADFIASLNIEQEIKDALQKMVDDGVFNTLIAQLFAQYKDDIDAILAQFMAQVEAKIAALENLVMTGKPRATMRISLGGLASLNISFGSQNRMTGRIDQNLTFTNGRANFSINTNDKVIQEISIDDDSYNVSIPLTSFYDLMPLGQSIVYEGSGFTQLPPLTGAGMCGLCAIAIAHKKRDGDNLFGAVFAATGVSGVGVLLDGAISLKNGVWGEIPFPTNDELRTLLP